MVRIGPALALLGGEGRVTIFHDVPVDRCRETHRAWHVAVWR